jgi:Large eukaryotic DNA virus major capsid protein/Major capsid protein N-terminus
MESIEQTFNGTGDFGRKVQCPVVRNGDLITKMYLRATVAAGDASALASTSAYYNAKWAWVTSLGHALIDNVELEIGGTRIDKHWGEWLTIWNELSRKYGQDRGYAKMIGNVPELTVVNPTHPAYTLWVPMRFFFCRFDGLALPLIALQYHEVRINFEFKPVEQLIVLQQGAGRTGKGLASALGLKLNDCSLYVDYIYLDSEERKRFAQASHEYLIEALQFPGAESVTGEQSRFRLNLNHPCKFLAWVNKLGRYTSANAFLAYHPTDLDNARLLATKRFVLKYATVSNGYATVDTYGRVTPADASLATAFAQINAVAVSVSGTSALADVDNITVLGELLPVDVISRSVSNLPTSFVFGNGVASGTLVLGTGATTGEGAAALDVLLTQWDNFGLQLDGSENSVTQALLQLNGQDRFNQREGQYFNYVQPWQHFSNTPADGVNVYSFALNPEEHQPSGTCNFSRIDNATLALTFGRISALTGAAESGFKTAYLGDDSMFSVYAVNYNVLRVMSGMAGLAYSN